MKRMCSTITPYNSLRLAPQCTTFVWYKSLLTASFNGHQRVVELLLAAGANPDIQEEVRTRSAVRRILVCIVISHSL